MHYSWLTPEEVQHLSGRRPLRLTPEYVNYLSDRCPLRPRVRWPRHNS